jgi:plastocyanin
MKSPALALALVITALACGDATTQPGDNQILVADNVFNPVTLNVTPGTTVTWTWTGSVAHQVVSDNGAFASSDLQGSGTHTATFNAPGTYPYHCAIHGAPNSGMHGTIVVAGDSAGLAG